MSDHVCKHIQAVLEYINKHNLELRGDLLTAGIYCKKCQIFYGF